MVSPGETVIEAISSASGTRTPAILSELYSSVTNVALETFQLNVEEPPAVMLSGSAVKELIIGGGAAAASATTTSTVSLTLPAALVAVRV